MLVVEFRLLGPVECTGDAGPVPLARAQERGLLAVLVLERGRVVPVDRLVELLWEEPAPARARSYLQTHISRLRAKLAAAGAAAQPVRLLTRGAGYQLAVPAEAVDADRFRRLVGAARQQPDPAQRAALLRQALALWRGPALADVPAGRIRELAAGLDDQRVDAQEELAETELGLGDQERPVAVLTELVAHHPLRERPVELLMRALYRSGRQAEALAVYRAARRRLVDRLGIEPGAGLRRLEQAILAQDPALEAGGGAVPPVRGPAVWRGPRSHLTGIVGRDRDLPVLRALLADHRLVTVVGVGGLGKTTLALHAAESLTLPGGRPPVTVVPAGPLSGGDELVLALAATLAVGGATVPEALAGTQQFLAGSPQLLVLDGCEHLAAGCARVVRALLSACPRLVVLATSREPLGLPEETVWRPDPLPVPAADAVPGPDQPAVALLLRRARAAVPGFAPEPADLDSADLAGLGRICRRVDGLPLALELAASRLRDLSPAQLADQLDRDLALLTTGAPDPLTAALDGSYRLLTEAEARLLARLSVFRGGFSVAAAEAVCGADPLPAGSVPATLASLVDRSLVQPYPQAGQRRYRLLEVVREFAAARLTGLEKPQLVADRHLDYWLATAREIDQIPIAGENVRRWWELGLELANLRAAADHGYAYRRTAEVVELTLRLYDYWSVHGAHAEQDRWLARAHPHLALCPAPLRSLAEGCLAMQASGRGDYLGAVSLLRRALPGLRRHDPTSYLEMSAAAVQFRVRLLDPGALPAAQRLYPRLVRVPDPHHRRHAGMVLAEALLTWGRYGPARALCEPAGPPDGPDTVTADLVRWWAITCLARLGCGDLPAAAAAAAGMRAALARPANFLSPGRAELVTATWALAVHAGAARPAIAALLPESPEPTRFRGYGLLIPLAEAERRAGDLAAARSHLAEALGHGTGWSDFTLTLPAVITAALLAADLGDAAAGRELAGRWERLRRRLGLPAPLGYAGPVATELGLDPAPPAPDQPRRWDEPELQDLLRRAYAWCAGPR